MHMDSLRIDSGIKRIAINDDDSRVIEFDPSDVLFAERFYALIRSFEEKQAEYETRAAELDSGRDVLDNNGLPTNLSESLSFMREVCEFLRNKIDDLFGAGTSQKAFGDALSLDMIEQFFTGIAPFIQNARAGKIEKYTTQTKRKVRR